MSEYGSIQTKFKDRQCLVEALMEMGWTKEEIEVHDEAQHLYGYQGDKRSQKANIIIRRKHVGSASNDLGFEKQKDGTYKAVISEYDSSSGGRHAGHTGGHNKKWVTDLLVKYNERVVAKKCKKAGQTFKKTVKTNDKGEREIILEIYGR